MPALTATRQLITDRLSVMGLRVQTGKSPYFEVAIATDPSLFRADARPRRTPSNFYSTRSGGPLPAERGDAVYLVPLDVLARFAGNERVYYVLATFPDVSRKNPEILELPTEAIPSVTLSKSFTGRWARRAIGVANRRGGLNVGGNGYGGVSADSLTWAGDNGWGPKTEVVAPPLGVSTVPSGPPAAHPATAQPTAMHSPAPVASESVASEPFAYDDGFGPWTTAQEVPPIAYDVQLIPQPDKLSCWAGSMAMLVGYRRQASVTPESLALEVGRSLRASYTWDMLEAVKDHFGFRDIPLPSNASLYPSPQQWYDWLKTYGPLWVTTVGAPSHAILVKGISGDLTPEGTTISILNPWDTLTSFDTDPIDFHPPNAGRAYTQSFPDFAADFGNLGLSNYGDWRVLHLPNGTAQTYSLGHESAKSNTLTRTRAMSAQSFDVGWTDVELVPQLTDMSCWAASAAMVVGWRDRISIDPSEVARGAGQWAAYSQGLNPADVPSLAQAWGLVMEAPQSYTIDAFRSLIETTGPLWVGAAVPGLHAVVVTGTYGDGTPDGTYLRINDPWGRAPNAPDGKGSQYVLTFRQFAQEYEGAANMPSVNIQILHSKPDQVGDRHPVVTAQAYSFWQSMQVRPASAAQARGSESSTVVGGQKVTRVAAAKRASRTLQVQALPAVATIAGTVLTRVLNNEGDIKWELDQLQGLKHPFNNPANASTAPYTTTRTRTYVDVDDVYYGPWIENLYHDRIYANFEIAWQHNGHSLGNITISNIETNDAVGWGLGVKANINDDANTYTLPPSTDLFAAIKVRFYYRFDRSIGSDKIYIQDFTLYGNGKVDRDERWTQ